MSESTMNDMFDASLASAPHYLLTDRRNLNRLLDIGLLVPELVASTEQGLRLLTSDELPGIQSVQGYPNVPVLIEVNASALDDSLSVLSASCISKIHFPSADDMEDYLATGYSNVPSQLFKFVPSPQLFVDRSDVVVSASLGEKNNPLIKERYRNYDVQGGLLWSFFEFMDLFDRKSALNEKLLTILNKMPQDSVSCLLHLMDVEVSSKNVKNVLKTYLDVVASYDLSEGWMPSGIITALKDRVSPEIQEDECFSKWFNIALGVINNEKELPHLTDDRELVLRAILLHILNPDVEAIGRMAKRENPPGRKVLSLAEALAVGRLGFSALETVDQATFAGRYFLVADYLTALINGKNLSVKACLETRKTGEKAEIRWNSRPLFSYVDDRGTVETDVDSATETSLDEVALAERLRAIADISSVSVDNGNINIELPKKSKHAVYGCPVISASIGDAVYVRSTLLKIGVTKSHKGYLTKNILHGLFLLQAREGQDFRVELPKDKPMEVVIRVPLDQASQGELKRSIERVVAVHKWLKSQKK